jgi:hypothetical protein
MADMSESPVIMPKPLPQGETLFMRPDGTATPATEEELFKHRLEGTLDAERRLSGGLPESTESLFRQLKDTQQGGEVRSLLMNQLRGTFNPPKTLEQGIPYGNAPEGFDPFTIRPQDLFSDPRSFNSLDRNRIKDILINRELNA